MKVEETRVFETRRKAQAWLRSEGFTSCRPSEITRRVRYYWKPGRLALLERYHPGATEVQIGSDQ
jgi:hypothetical protein